LLYITDCFYDTIVISDHAPITLTYSDPRLLSNLPKWRFHPKWLLEEKLCDYVTRQIEVYFDINTTQTSVCIRWEAFKVFIRGILISSQAINQKATKKKKIDCT